MTVEISVFSAPAEKFFVNSFILENADTVVLIDTQFLTSTATELAAQVAARGKRLAGIVITHPHPDHFNGLPVLLERFGPVPVYANQPTIDTMRATQAAKRAQWTPVFGADYPLSDALPDRVLPADATIEIGGIGLRVVELGPGECADNSVVFVPGAGALIASDLIYHRCHPWLAEHRTAAWLAQLDRVERLFAGVARNLPGHGPAGGPALFEAQRGYIAAQRAVVARHARGGVLDAAGLAAARAVALDGRPDWPLEGLIDMNAAAIAAELA